MVFSCCNFCELVKNLPVCGWPHKKSLSFHVHVCLCICQDHDVKWWSVSGVKRNSWRFNSITLDKLLNDMIPIFSSPSEIRQISSPLLKLFLHEIITDAIQFISLQSSLNIIDSHSIWRWIIDGGRALVLTHSNSIFIQKQSCSTFYEKWCYKFHRCPSPMIMIHGKV